MKGPKMPKMPKMPRMPKMPKATGTKNSYKFEYVKGTGTAKPFDQETLAQMAESARAIGKMVTSVFDAFAKPLPKAGFDKRAELFRTELKWLCMRHDVSLVGPSVGRVNGLIVDGSKNFDDSGITVNRKTKGRAR